MKRFIILMVNSLLLFVITGCENAFEENANVKQTNKSFINDSIRKISLSDLPDNVKESFQQVLITKNLVQKGGSKNSEPEFEFLENEVISIEHKNGVINYSIPIKEGFQVEKYLKESKTSAQVSKLLKKDCEQRKGIGGGHGGTTIQMMTINVGENGKHGSPTLAVYRNYGSFINSEFTNLINGDSFSNWVHNGDGSAGNGGAGGNTNSGSKDSGKFDWSSIVRDVWGKIISLKDQIARYFRNIRCGCPTVRKPAQQTSRVFEPDQSDSCDCEDDNYMLDNDFSTILPESFFSYEKDFFKDKDCECLFEKGTEILVFTDINLPPSMIPELNVYLDCSCQKNEVGGVALFLSLSPEEKLFLEKNIDFNAKICKLLTEEMHSKEAVGFAKEAVRVKMQGGEVDFFNRLLLDKSFVTNQKLLCIGYKYYITQNNEISQRLKEFLKDGPRGYLKLTAESNFRGRFKNEGKATASTVPPNENDIIEIAFNIQTGTVGNIANTSTILLGFAFIHELVHAEINRKLFECRDLPYVNRGNLEDPDWRELLNKMQDKFPDMYQLYEYYDLRTDIPNESQHEYMAFKYINAMAKALAQFDRNGHSREFYENVAWVGLQNTISFKNKFSKDRVAQKKYDDTLNQAENETKDCRN